MMLMVSLAVGKKAVLLGQIALGQKEGSLAMLVGPIPRLKGQTISSSIGLSSTEPFFVLSPCNEVAMKPR